MDIFFKNVVIPAGSSMGGFEPNRLSTAESQDLEINGITFFDQSSEKNYDLIAVDTLYAGDLVKEKNDNKIFAASHTHFAPMLDRSKPVIGAADEEAIEIYSNVIEKATHLTVEVDACRIHKGEVSIPVYRRFDFPDSVINRALSRHLSIYPNELVDIDKSVYLFEFLSGESCKFVIAYHACHPISRNKRNIMPPDYIGSIRKTVRKRFGQVPCIFLLGCSGDVRPNVANKRVSWLPRSRFNWRFSRPTPIDKQNEIDQLYESGVLNAQLQASFALSQNAFKIGKRVLKFKKQPDVEVPTITIGDSVRFEFWPFEVSHLFHMEVQKKDPLRFIVSCANHTLGYLPHPKQISFGGYEVDGSRGFSLFPDRIEILSDWLL